MIPFEILLQKDPKYLNAMFLSDYIIRKTGIISFAYSTDENEIKEKASHLSSKEFALFIKAATLGDIDILYKYKILNTISLKKICAILDDQCDKFVKKADENSGDINASMQNLVDISETLKLAATLICDKDFLQELKKNNPKNFASYIRNTMPDVFSEQAISISPEKLGLYIEHSCEAALGQIMETFEVKDANLRVRFLRTETLISEYILSPSTERDKEAFKDLEEELRAIENNNRAMLLYVIDLPYLAAYFNAYVLDSRLKRKEELVDLGAPDSIIKNADAICRQAEAYRNISNLDASPMEKINIYANYIELENSDAKDKILPFLRNIFERGMKSDNISL